MQIGCPRCDETYRIEPSRLPAARVRVACLACGEALFLRLLDGASAVAGAGSLGEAVTPRGVAAEEPPPVLAADEEVPLWREPRPVEPADAAAAESGPSFERLQRLGIIQEGVEGAGPGAERIRGAEPVVRADSVAEPLPSAESVAEPVPGLEPPGAPGPRPLETAAERATSEEPLSGRDRPAAGGAAPAGYEPTGPGAPAAMERPLAPFVEQGTAAEPLAERPLALFVEAGAAGAEAAPRPRSAGAFSFARVGDVSARAERLARALVSDILVYHPAKVEQGNREGALREVVREEVEKSWDEYCERLGPDAARANRGPFVAALNEILARGKPVF